MGLLGHMEVLRHKSQQQSTFKKPDGRVGVAGYVIGLCTISDWLIVREQGDVTGVNTISP